MPIKPHPLRRHADQVSCAPFFVVTAGRSGSTLLRAIINQDPTICVPPESHVLGPLARKFQRAFRFLPWDYLVRAVASEFQSKIPGFGFWHMDMHPYYAEALALPRDERSLARLIDLVFVHYARDKKPGASRWGDKSISNAFFLPLIDRLFPDASYIVLVRDGRDVAVSLVKADTTAVTEVSVAADYWRRNVEHSQRFVAGLESSRYIEVRYEDLVRQPETTAERVYEFLGIPFDPAALEVSDSVESLGDADREIHRNLRRPINADSIGKGRESLDAAQRAALDEQLRAKLGELGYDVD